MKYFAIKKLIFRELFGCHKVWRGREIFLSFSLFLSPSRSWHFETHLPKLSCLQYFRAHIALFIYIPHTFIFSKLSIPKLFGLFPYFYSRITTIFIVKKCVFFSISHWECSNRLGLSSRFKFCDQSFKCGISISKWHSKCWRFGCVYLYIIYIIFIYCEIILIQVSN